MRRAIPIFKIRQIERHWDDIQQLHSQIYEQSADPEVNGYNAQQFLNLEEDVQQTLVDFYGRLNQWEQQATLRNIQVTKQADGQVRTYRVSHWTIPSGKRFKKTQCLLAAATGQRPSCCSSYHPAEELVTVLMCLSCRTGCSNGMNAG